MAGFGKTPGFAYPGGKVRLRKWLVSMMPKSGRMYVEPFAGRGNVFWLDARCLRFEKWWLNDIWTKPFFDAILEADLSEIPIRLTKECSRTIRARLESGDASQIDHLLSPTIFFSGGTGDGIATSATSILKRNMGKYRQHIRTARFIMERRAPRVSALCWTKMKLCMLSTRDFIYLDPPYMDADCDYVIDTVDHEELLSALQNAHFRWLLSGYASELYGDMIGDPFTELTVPVTTAHRSKCKMRTECVWRNY